eukprot:5519130-Prymnesium_polylepis.1
MVTCLSVQKRRALRSSPSCALNRLCGEHDDEAVKAAAVAMRHSSKTQASAAYDKGASDKRVSAAMK